MDSGGRQAIEVKAHGDSAAAGAGLAALVARRGAPDMAAIEAAAMALMRAGDGDAAVAPLEALCEAHPALARGWWLLGVARHDAQRHEEAMAAMARAAALAPDDPRALLGDAQLRYETGRPAAAAFAALHRRRPDDDGVTRNFAGALAADGDPAAADALLAAATARRPDWLEGQAQLATLRRTRGEADYDRGYADAVAVSPDALPLRLAWFALLAQAKRWGDAARVVADAAARCGDRPPLVAARRYLAAETGADDPFADVASGTDPGTGLARVRHALRRGRIDEAERIAAAFVATPAGRLFWPYLALAWRAAGDARAAWLDRPDALVATVDLGLGDGELAELAALLRTLHVAAAPYLDQSVRGGTQTDRPLMFRHEPVMRRARAAIEAAVRDYAAALPPPEPGHPLLGTPRGRLRFSGSWSVRLAAQGFHASHTHPAGWLSSACYVALPVAPGPAPAGHLRLGTPPPELGLDLPAYRTIAPRPGLLALFPSTLWHATAPFADGERLTIAFDVAVPRG